MKPKNRKLQEQITPAERAKLKRMYEGLKRLQGIGGEPEIANPSENIDEILYGENWAWRGMTYEER